MRRGAGHHGDAVTLQRVADHVGRVGVLAGQQPWRGLEQIHPGAEPREGLGQLAAHGAATEDGETARLFGQLEDRFAGQDVGAVHSVDVGDRGSSAGGDDGSGERQAHAVDLHGRGRRERGRAEEHVHAESGKACRGIVRRDGRARGPHARHHRAEVHVVQRGVDAERRAARNRGGSVRRRQQRLRRHAAGVQAIAAEAISLDQGDGGAEAGRAGSRDQARGASADHHEIVAGQGRWGCPARRPDVGEQRLIAGVGGVEDHVALSSRQ